MALNQVRHPYFDRWLGQLPVVVAAEIAALLDYLSEHGQGSDPSVRAPSDPDQPALPGHE
jgi:hypothetical protein